MGFSPAARAVDLTWKNQFTFYGDNTEFFEPFRAGETLLGQQGKSRLQAAVGKNVFLSGGVFGDYRSVENPEIALKPLLSIEYRSGGTCLIMGTLETVNRHGFLEPLEVTTLEITRSVEYGLQWLQKDEAFAADLFLSWRQLNTPLQPESFDFGGVLRGWPGNPFSVELQMYGYHEGGQQFSFTPLKNWVLALGFRARGALGPVGEGRLAAFGLLSGELESDNLDDAAWGGGGYARAGLAFGEGFEFFCIGWKGRDFFAQDGDANYSSFNQGGDYYQADRLYAELGLQKEFSLEEEVSFKAEFRVHFIEQYSAYSFRLAAYAPFDIEIVKDSTAKTPNPSSARKVDGQEQHLDDGETQF